MHLTDTLAGNRDVFRGRRREPIVPPPPRSGIPLSILIDEYANLT